MEHGRDAAAGRPGRRVVVPAEQDGWRLDRATGALWPGIGLRGRRRRIEAGGVRLAGRVRGAGSRVRAGDVLEEVALGEPEAVFGPADIPVLAAEPDFGALAKPGGLHSASLGPGGGASLEALLPGIFPDRRAWLLSRLDFLTSGIVPVAFAEAGRTRWRRLEDAGEVAKTYLAVVHGRVAAPLVLDRALDTDDRATTRVLARAEADPLRHTLVTPERCLAELTLVRCRIAKGARHQIRAHLAAAGHPLVGDPRYGRGEGERLFLHATALASPVLVVALEPPWTLANAVAPVGVG
jgi:23S rRNA pseudouridine1911/1915/1917 synthase